MFVFKSNEIGEQTIDREEERRNTTNHKHESIARQCICASRKVFTLHASAACLAQVPLWFGFMINCPGLYAGVGGGVGGAMGSLQPAPAKALTVVSTLSWLKGAPAVGFPRGMSGTTRPLHDLIMFAAASMHIVSLALHDPFAKLA